METVKEPRKLFFVLGTRPEAVKLAPLILAAKQSQSCDVYVCSTGQHRQLLDGFLDFFEIAPDYDLQMMRPHQSLGSMLARTIEGVETLLDLHRPDVVIVQGDTLSCMAAAMAAFMRRIRVAHVEAGLRSGDLFSPWPEEFNRRVVALATHYHFAPTERSRQVLLNEGVASDKVYMTGNTVIDSLQKVVAKIDQNADIRSGLQEKYKILKDKKFILVTNHRRESFDGGLRNIFKAIIEIVEKTGLPVLLPVHMNPVVHENIRAVLDEHAQWLSEIEAGEMTKKIILCDPLEYLDFIYILNKCHFVISDSGGVQEEAPALAKPLLVTREVTERVEGIESGSAKLVGFDTQTIVDAALRLHTDQEFYTSMAQAKNPYGDGHSSQRILDVLLKE